jgi:uncharacterized low-complexity protein
VDVDKEVNASQHVFVYAGQERTHGGMGEQGEGEQGEGKEGEGKEGEGKEGAGEQGEGKEGAGKKGEGKPRLYILLAFPEVLRWR